MLLQYRTRTLSPVKYGIAFLEVLIAVARTQLRLFLSSLTPVTISSVTTFAWITSWTLTSFTTIIPYFNRSTSRTFKSKKFESHYRLPLPLFLRTLPRINFNTSVVPKTITVVSTIVTTCILHFLYVILILDPINLRSLPRSFNTPLRIQSASLSTERIISSINAIIIGLLPLFVYS